MVVEDPRLSLPRKDVGKWGALTNKFLRVAHNEDGTLKATAFEGVIGNAIGAGLMLEGTTLLASTVLQKYHNIDPSDDVQSLLGAADFAAFNTLLGLGTNSTASFDRILVGDGSVGVPSIAFTSNTDMGIYLDSGPKIGFTISGASAFRIDSQSIQIKDSASSNFGIITFVGTAMTADKQLSFNLNDGSRILSMSGDLTVEAGGGIINSDLSTDADWQTSGSVTGSSLVTGGTIVATGSITGSAFKGPGFSGAGLVFTDSIPGSWTISDGTSAFNVTGASSINQDVRTSASPVFAALTVDTTTLVVNASGYEDKVGIGTLTPGYILDIDAGEIGDNNYDGLRIVDTGWTMVSHPMLEFYNSHVDFNGSLVRIYGEIGLLGENPKLYFAVADSSKSLQDRMVIDKDGNVGIEEVAPQDKLEVNGKILVKDKLCFTQDDRNEYIDSLADGYMDYGATTAHRFNANVEIATANKINFRDIAISIGSPFDGTLDINADVSIEMFYDNADVGDGVDGQSLNINRRAGEKDDYISLYVDKDQKGLIGFSGDDDLLQLAANVLTVNGSVTATGVGNFAGLTLNLAQDYEFTNRGSALVITGKGASSANYEFYTGAGDGTDEITIEIFPEGLPADLTHSERIRLGFFPTFALLNDIYALVAAESGDGTLHPFHMDFTGSTDADQLILGTDGNVSMAGDLAVTGALSGAATTVSSLILGTPAFTFTASLDEAPTPDWDILTMANNADHDMHFALQSGSSASQRAYLRWNDYDGTIKWTMGRSATNTFNAYDATLGNHWLQMISGSYLTLCSGGTDPVRINAYDDASTGTGGFEVWTGGATPTSIFDVSSAGIVTTKRIDVTGDGTHGVRINQGADGKGLFIYGFDDKSASYCQCSVNSSGDFSFISSGAQLFSSGAEIQFNTAVNQNIWMTLGDTAGVKKVYVRDNGFNIVASIDSNGLGTFNNGVDTPKVKITVIGGCAVKLTNKTGGNTVAGQLVIASTGTDNAFATAGANAENVIGIVLDAGVADGSEAWVVGGGIADVLMDGGGSAHGDRIIASATVGSADVWNTGGAVATHFREIGHCLETRVGAGLARVDLHFN